MSRPAAFREELEEAGLVHVDARVLGFHLVGAERYAQLTRLLLRGLETGEVSGQSSSLSVYQVTAGPYREGQDEAAGRARDYLTAFRGLELVDVTPAIAAQAAQVRARLGGRMERAFQVATALDRGAAVFLTEGSGIRRIAGMGVMDLDDYADL